MKLRACRSWLKACICTQRSRPHVNSEVTGVFEQQASTPTFASFDSPAHTPARVAIPPSPSFNALVSRQKVKFTNPSGSTSRHSSLQKFHPPSHSSSLASQASVAKQLTQESSAEEESNDQDSEEQHSRSSGSSNTSTAAGSDTDEGTSKFPYDSFLIHHHGPKSLSHLRYAHREDATSKTRMHIQPSSLSSSDILSADGKGTVSEHQDLDGSQSPGKKLLSPLKSKRKGDLLSQSSNPKVSKTRKKGVFRSGILQITPVSLVSESILEGSQEKIDHSQRDSM